MSLFVATGSNPPATIHNNGFFPSIDTDDFVKTQKLDATFSPDRVTFALTLAITDANRALMAWQVIKEAAGYVELGDVPAVSVNNESTLITLYKQAVFSFAKANLLEKYRDYDTTNQGGKKADILEPNIDIHRRDARWAIADLQNKPRTVVELI
jgi:hypothetical protein